MEKNNIPFFKYQGAGNDFVMIDNRENRVFDSRSIQMIRQICDRRFGVGGDGLILLQNHPKYDFEMIYYNSDGTSSMCGNGGRCIVAFAKYLGIIKDSCSFLAIDGGHEATINEAGNWVELKMINVDTIDQFKNDYIINTGSPHYITYVEAIEKIDVFEEGQRIRYSSSFEREGINVNFIEPTHKGLSIATYERGVEAETLACGTGVTAAAISYYVKQPALAERYLEQGGIPVQAKGGNLKVRFDVENGQFTNIWLCGPAEKVFEGTITIKK